MRDETEPTSQDQSGSPATGVDGVRHERVLSLDEAEAWELIATAEGLATWLADRVDLELEPGAEGEIIDGRERLLTEVESIDEGRRVSWRWWSEERGASVVDLTIEPLGERSTRLVVTELPLRALEVPAYPLTIDGRRSGGGPELSASVGAGARASGLLALA